MRRLALLLASGFALILLVVMVANAESMLADFAAAGVRESAAHVWIWEATSMVAWISAMPAIWWLVARVRPPAVAWPLVALAILLASVPVSLWHVGLMVALRKLAYAAQGESYRFFGALGNQLLYEYRKDAATYLQFAAVAATVQWLLARAAPAPAAPALFEVSDGAVTHRLPITEIDSVEAAGNYVEIAWRDRRLLHRATLSAVEATLGAAFVRIHRGRLVRRAAIRTLQTERSGDFSVTLASGATLRGSRRYRSDAEQAPPA